MNLEDFVMLAETPNLVQILNNGGGSTQSRQEIDVVDVLCNGLAQSNLLAHDIIVQNGGYSSPIPRHGLVMSKLDTDYEADEKHYVYRAVFLISNAATMRPANEGVTTRDSALARLLEMSIDYTHNVDNPVSLPSNLEGVEAIEITQYGRMYESNIPYEIPEERTWNSTYQCSFNAFQRRVPINYNSVLRGTEYTLFHSVHGVIGAIKVKVLRDTNELTPLREDDMAYARRFIKLDDDYDGWIPDEIETTEPVISADSFRLYRIGDTDRSIRATTVLDKTKDRRTHLYSETQLKYNDKRYAVPPGEYFFAPTTDINLMSMFDYDVWLMMFSKAITMTKSNSRVGFLSGSAEYRDVKSINVKSKIIEGSVDKEIDSTFTRRANSGRLK